MGQLNILGAQRVKALGEMLETKYKQELTELNKQYSDVLIKTEIDESFGLTEKRNEIESLRQELQRKMDEVNDVTGEKQSVQLSIYSPNMNTLYQKERQKKRNELSAKQVELRKLYDDKKNRLWLCETLEDAKQIVGI